MRSAFRLSLLLPLLSPVVTAAEGPRLTNGLLTLTFDATGLRSIRDETLGRTVPVTGDRSVLSIDGTTFDSAAASPRMAQEDGRITYRYEVAGGSIEAFYELQPGWRFLTKHLRIHREGRYRVQAATVFAATLDVPVADTFRINGGRGGAFLRMSDPLSLFALLQNPFCELTVEGGRVSLRYAPDMTWSSADGPFETDRACLGTVTLSGTRYPASMLPEWHYLPDPGAFGAGAPYLDIGEVLGLADCVRAFLTYRPEKPVRVHIDWCENSYQIDVSKPEGWTEYRRIISMAAELGCDHILFTPQDLELASLEENRDAWGWESLLWLNLGQKIRKGEWVPGKDPLPSVVAERLAEAKRHGISLMAYVYPSLPFLEDPAWTAWVKRVEGSPMPGGYLGADTGERGFQDWLVDQLVAFKDQTGVSGYSFDHWWIAYDDATSKYAQWYGCRRILSELRRRRPDVIIDGRQQYQWFGPWTWVAGSYPHPLATDEQPQSFRSFPDLHWSRGSADRQRYMAWWYRVQNFCPIEIVPGYMTHQTMRNDAEGVMRRDRYRTADWDSLGWTYSVISSIATAPYHLVVNFIPARNEDEFQHFPATDRAWMRRWLDWTERNISTLRKVRPIIGQPMVGRCDGTAAIDGDRGFIFLFNPNYRSLDATFTLDGSIGMSAPEGDARPAYVLRQLYPDLGMGRLIGHPTNGTYRFGDAVSLPMAGASALVLELAPADPGEILLLNVAGRARLTDTTLKLTDLSGEVGTAVEALVRLPEPRAVSQVLANGRLVPFTQREEIIAAAVRFAGTRFARREQIGTYDPEASGRRFAASFSVPRRIFKQFEARKAAWPIPYDADEIAATWNAPHRLLLFVNIADPKDDMEIAVSLDGRPVPAEKAYSSVYAQAVERTFVGFAVDLTGRVEPDRQYEIAVELPEGLKPGQFQGVFFDTVEAEFTAEVDS